MKNKFIKILSLLVVIVLIIFFSVSSFFSKDLSGYGKSKWGMTVEEVLKSENAELSQWGSLDGERLIKNDYVKIGNDDYSLIYSFDENSKKLIRVSLLLSDMKYASLIFKDIENKLIIKYGEPLHSKPFKRDMVFRYEWFEYAESIWVVGETKVEVSYANSYKNDGIFVVRYSYISNPDEVSL